MSCEPMTPVRPRVLIVDDCETSLMFEELALEPRFEVLKARDGDEALRIVERERVDLVLLDLMLPDMDGFEVLRRMRCGPARHVPVLVLTVQGGAAEVARARAQGCDGYLTKPVASRELLRLVTHHVGA